MANQSKDISQTVKGMNWDFHPMHLTDGMYAFAQNAVVEGVDGSGFPILQNEPSNILISNFPPGNQVVGFISVPEQERIIFLLVNPTTGMSQIGEAINPDACRKGVQDTQGSCDDCGLNLIENAPLETTVQKPCVVFRTIVEDSCLNFNIGFPVSIQFNLLACSLQLIITDANNPRRVLEFDFINNDPTQGLVLQQRFFQIIGFANPPCDTPIFGPNLNCNALNIQPNIETPCIEFKQLTGGGSNKAGVYQFFIAMADVNGNVLTSFLSGTNPIPIFTKEITVATDYVTDRSIKLNILNLDPTGAFAYYTLAVAKTIDGVTSFFDVGVFPITQTTVIYTGNNNAEIPLTADNIFAIFPFFKTAGIVAQSNGILFFANVNEFPKPNLQRVANNIKLQWQTIAIPEPVYRDPKNVNKFRGYMRDEVYAMGIQFVYETGEESNAYHIPGRIAISSDLDIISNDDVIPPDNCSGTPLNMRWQVYNTATLLGGDLSIYDGCTESCYQFGDFAYWESIERYPLNPLIWGDLCGEPIRHHKFPDSNVTHIHNLQNGSVDASGATFHKNNIVFPIGVKVDHNSVRASIASAVAGGLITAADAARIVGYRIIRGNRFGNKSVVAKGLLYDVNRYQRKDAGNLIDIEPIYFANYPYNDLRANPFLTDDFQNYALNNIPEGPDLPFTFSNRYTFHSPDTHFSQPGLGTELKLETVEYGQNQGFFNKCKKQAREKLLSEFAYGVAFTGAVALAIANLVPPRNSSYTVSTHTTTVTGTVPLMQFTDGTSTVAIPSAESLTETVIPDGAGLTVDRGTGILSFPEPLASSYTVTQTPSAVFQNLSPTAAAALQSGTFNPEIAILGTFASAVAVVGTLGSMVFVLSQILSEMAILIDLMKALVPYKDWTVQYNSIGKYNEYTTVPNNAGVKRRVITASDYLDDNNQFINEPVDPITGQFDSIKFNNLYREDAVYLKYNGTAFPTAGVSSGIQDLSRERLSDFPFTCSLNIPKYEPISSYYASIKNSVTDQYGTVFNIQYLRTGSCAFDMFAQNSGCTGVYGGDTFISRFALKRKLEYFLASTFGLPDGTDFDFSQVTNVAFPRYYFNNTATVGSEIGSLSISEFTSFISSVAAIYKALGGPSSIRDCASNTVFEQVGYIYLYHYGIPYFFAESDYDVDYRYGTDNLAGDFYPNQGDLDFWLQEINVPITEPNQYHYNNTYSKQNTEASIAIDQPDFQPGRLCRTDFPNRIIFSNPPISTNNQTSFIFPANNVFNTPLTDGAIVAVDGIENQTVLVRSENKTSIFKSILRIPVDGQTVQVGNAGLFINPPQDFGTTDLGYIGTQNKGILNTEYGHIWADAKRGQVFNMGTGAVSVDEISKNGMKNWFKENLPFRLLRDFPNMPIVDIDNNFIGAGLIYSFDKRNNRFTMTKLDFKRTNSTVLYDPILKQFFIPNGLGRTIVTLGDPKFFKDASWTVSYNFWTQSWVSFHSYKPNFYIDFIDFFGSGINTPTVSSFWAHDLFNGSFQVFYGKLFPFVVEPVIKFEEQMRVLNSLAFDTEVRRYSNEFDYTVKKGIPGFNKTIVYNDWYNSGLMTLVKTDKNDFSIVGKYPIKGFTGWDIEVATANYKWKINQLFALNKDNSEIPLWIYAANNEEKTLNNSAFNYSKNDYALPKLRGQWFKARYMNDNLSNYKILFKFDLNNQTLQFR